MDSTCPSPPLRPPFRAPSPQTLPSCQLSCQVHLSKATLGLFICKYASKCDCPELCFGIVLKVVTYFGFV